MAVTRYATPRERPETDAGYLEMMTKIIFMAGLNRTVVENKWPGFLDAFAEFDPARVASFSEEDVERLADDESIIRYGAKIRAVVDNANLMTEIATQHGSFGEWLRAAVEQDGWAQTASELARSFRYVSEASARNFLFAVGEDVGEVTDEISRKYGP
ncbi:MAG: DNA-3-methyladenine glycosylase I [Anaerolineae bacterium]|nr:DNA-3-methyladenine glycosylase I [Anaerolineae bacterium]